VAVAVRPEKMRLAADGDGGPNRVRGRVEDIAYLGDVSVFYVRLGSGQRVQMTLTNARPIVEQTLTWDQEVILAWDPDGGVVLTD
jgi:putrescine transport system ATP-binding protein